MKFTFSLRFSLNTAFISVVVASSAILGILTFISASQFLRETVRLRLSDDVAIASVNINADLHAKLQTPEDENSEAYKKIRKYLQNVRNKATGIKFVYTIRKNENGEIYFVVDAEENPEDFSHLGDVYEDPTGPMLEAFEKPYGIRVEEEFSTDQWGTYLSSYAPVVNDRGELEAVLGMDISAENVIAYERTYLILIFLVSLSATVFVSFIGFYIAGKISKPLKLLESEISRVQKFNLDSSEIIDSRITEIINIDRAVENMKGGLRSFKKYVPSGLVADLIRVGKEASLGGEKKQITIFFSDIKNFTDISERMPPETLAKYLEIYFGGITSILLENQGTVDKYIGDAIMAFWGAPIQVENSARLACVAALKCQEFLKSVEPQFIQDGIEPFHTRIGINTGDAIVGNIGYRERFSYTAIGDNVNLASRLEAVNKYYDTRILISEFTRTDIGDEFVTRLVDIVAVKGKKSGIRIYELMEKKENMTEELNRFLQKYETAIQLYLEKKWTEGEKSFAEVLELNKDDRVSQILRERCLRFEKSPPPENWKGIIQMREK